MPFQFCSKDKKDLLTNNHKKKIVISKYCCIFDAPKLYHFLK